MHLAKKALAHLIASSLGMVSLSAIVTVHDPLPVTHNVVVQPIITKHSDGTTATFLGSSNSETYIKGQINRIWAQSGISVSWLPPVEYEDDFAFDGSTVSNYSNKNRPQSHLNQIVSNAGTPPKSSVSTVVNMFFVEIVPGFEQLSDNYANGLAKLDANGIAMHVGSNLVGWSGGRDVVASVIAHEIGHNLGLSHFNGSSNLMASGDPDSYLINSQTEIVFTDHGGLDGYDFLAQATTPSNYELWAEAEELTGDPDDDEDNDGLSNIIEFVLSFDPNASSSLPAPVWTADGLTWTFDKNSEAAEDGIEVVIEVSGDCEVWSPAGSTSSSIVITDNNSELSARLNAGLQGHYMRLNVSIPEDLGQANALFADSLLDPPSESQLSCCSHGGCGCRSAQIP